MRLLHLLLSKWFPTTGSFGTAMGHFSKTKMVTVTILARLPILIYIASPIRFQDFVGSFWNLGNPFR